MNRVLRVARMQLVNTQTFVWVPLVIVAAAFAISYLVFVVLNAALDVSTERGFNGASQAPLWYFLVIGMQALTMTFPFSQAMSVSRRTFYLGTLLVASGASLALATLFTVLRPLEEATGGWGVGSYMFSVPWATDGPWYHGLVFFFALALLFFVLGFWSATIYKRWGTMVTTIVLTALALALIGVLALITWQHWWGNVGTWFAGQTSLTIGLLLLALTAVLAGASYLTLRRTTP